MSLSNFIQYHNAVPIALGVIFLGAGATFAATNPEAIYSAQQTVVSIDNTYIANRDISNYSPQVQIVNVTEDADNYYVAYRFTTIDIQNSVWQDVVKSEIMKVSKADLGEYRDLGVYVTQQLKQIVDREIERLTTTQEIERRNVTQKTVATAYGGLVGKFLDTNTETLPGYTPVVTPPPPPVQVAAAVVSETPLPTNEPATSGSATTTETQVSIPPPSDATSTPIGPTLQVLGDNPARVAVGSTYSDLGASITGPSTQDLELSIRVYINGNQTTSVVLDTSVARVWTVRYAATNAAGITSSIERQVIIFEPTSPVSPNTVPGTTTSATTTPATTTPSAAPVPVTTTTAPVISPPAPTPTEPLVPAATTTSETTPEPTPTPETAPPPPAETPAAQ